MHTLHIPPPLEAAFKPEQLRIASLDDTGGIHKVVATSATGARVTFKLEDLTTPSMAKLCGQVHIHDNGTSFTGLVLENRRIAGSFSFADGGKLRNVMFDAEDRMHCAAQYYNQTDEGESVVIHFVHGVQRPECTVCRNSMRFQAELPCGHPLCTECIISHAQSRRTASDVKCPLCRAQVVQSDDTGIISETDVEDADAASDAEGSDALISFARNLFPVADAKEEEKDDADEHEQKQAQEEQPAQHAATSTATASARSSLGYNRSNFTPRYIDLTEIKVRRSIRALRIDVQVFNDEDVADVRRHLERLYSSINRIMPPRAQERIRTLMQRIARNSSSTN